MGKIWTKKRLVRADLVNLAAAQPNEFVELCEAAYQDGIRQTAGEILTRGSRMVLLAGPSGCGKTTSAQKLAKELEAQGCPAQVMEMDNFYLDLDDYPRLPDGTKDYENVTALDLPLLHHCLEQLLEEGQTLLPIFDFTTERRKPQTQPLSMNGGVVILEGIHALNPAVSQGLNSRSLYKIYTGVREEYCDREGRTILNAKELRLARRCLRDTCRGRDAAATILKAAQVNQGEDLYIRRFKDQANCILDTSFSYEPCVLAGRLPQIYRAIPRESPSYSIAQQLACALEQFHPLDSSLVPVQSMLREFLGM